MRLAEPIPVTSGIFALETPRGNLLRPIEAISGWYLPLEKDAETYSLQVTVDGKPTATLSRGYRPDVAAAYPANPRAVRSGFFGDVVLQGADWGSEKSPSESTVYTVTAARTSSRSRS